MKLIVSTLLLLWLMAPAAAAQTTRVDAIAEKQAEKAGALAPEGPSEAERIIKQVLLSPLLSGADGAYPWFGSVFGGSGMAAGAGYLKRLESAAYLNVQTGISINTSMVLRGTFAAPELRHGMMQAEVNAQWLSAKDVSYFGPGQQSSKDRRDSYDFTPIDIGGSVTVRPARYVFLTGGYSFLDLKTTRDAPVFAEAEAPGLDQKLTFNTTRGTIAFDWRPAAAYSTRGGMYRATFEHNQESSGKPFTFRSQEYEVVQQLPLVREQFVLAFRGLMTLASPYGDDEVPVMLSPYLGSGSTLRGYSNRRFTDRNRVLLTGEYRWRPSRYLDMAIFYDTGQVAHDPGDFSTKLFESAWGLGARFHGPNFNALRIEVARGREGIRLIFAGSQPF
jgi:hypothetical protein